MLLELGQVLGSYDELIAEQQVVELELGRVLDNSLRTD